MMYCVKCFLGCVLTWFQQMAASICSSHWRVPCFTPTSDSLIAPPPPFTVKILKSQIGGIFWLHSNFSLCLLCVCVCNSCFLCQPVATWHPCARHSPGSLEHRLEPHAYKVGTACGLWQCGCSVGVLQYYSQNSKIFCVPTAMSLESSRIPR